MSVNLAAEPRIEKGEREREGSFAQRTAANTTWSLLTALCLAGADLHPHVFLEAAFGTASLDWHTLYRRMCRHEGVYSDAARQFGLYMRPALTNRKAL